jgi:DNA recombination protein RmuC
MAMNQQIRSEAGQSFQKQEQSIAHTVGDMKTRFDETQKLLKKFEEERAAMYARLDQSIGQVLNAEHSLIAQTSSLKKALTSSTGIRGSWGQNLLQQILEQSDLVRGQHFDTQVTIPNPAGELRPDFVIKLPNGRRLVIDAKEVTGEYVLAQESDDPERQKQHYARLVANIRNNITQLSRKEYQKHVDSEIPFVVMFIPNEAAIYAALTTDPLIYDEARKKQVVLAGPMTLIPVIHLISHIWNQQQVTNNARELFVVVEELGNRLKKFVGHLNDIRSGVQKASEGWNNAVGSWQSRVNPQIEKTKSLSGSLKDIEIAEPLSPELKQISD